MGIIIRNQAIHTTKLYTHTHTHTHTHKRGIYLNRETTNPCWRL